jgi:hypothetical protein
LVQLEDDVKTDKEAPKKVENAKDKAKKFGEGAEFPAALASAQSW